MWLCRRLLSVPWTARRPNQSIIKAINPENSVEGQMLKLKHQYCGHLMQRAESLEKTPVLGNTYGKMRRVQRIRWLDSILHSMDVNVSKLQKIVEDRRAWLAAVHGVGHPQEVGCDLGVTTIKYMNNTWKA